MAKPDDRSDNVDKLQEMVEDTIGNLEESEEYLNEFADQLPEQERQAIRQNNENRRASIEGMREEIKDEAHDKGV
ncbi:small acid-soluble spore protein Tlp [Cohnella pontilimi]|uniref:Small acid-soluble spore protein Tlp n=1 Tax=Cohnella pontilimi TaxID=2564100 RepID=A0A4U0FH33_9BACL|nr:small acid-soluble spore protein Tlp [Cohnella pontilimi]TJY44228.1 small acid-soluble spore protein Tlp [Cohnella pontilimi]